MKFISLVLCLFIPYTWAFDIESIKDLKLEENKTINNVELSSGFKDGYRYYKGVVRKSYNAKLEDLVFLTTNFSNRCNNKHKRRRKFSDKNPDCPLYNKNVVEAIIHRDIKKDYVSEKNEIDRFIVHREIYNRERFHHYDLVIVKQWLNEKKQKNVSIWYTALHDDEVKKYIKPEISFDSAFVRMTGHYIYTEIEPNKVDLIYTYSSKTDHFVLRQSLVVGQVYDGMSEGIKSAVDVIEEGLIKIIKNKQVN